MDLDWRRSFKLERPETEALGLDIGSSTVKVVQLHKKDTGYVVTAAGIVDIAASDDNNNRKDINTIIAIRRCLESVHTVARLAVCSVCGPEVAVRAFKFPSLQPEEIQGAIQLEASQVCPFNVDDGAVGYQLTSDDEHNVTGVLVAATNKLVKKKRQLAKNASLKCILMDVDGLALLNCFSEYGTKQAGPVRNSKGVNSNMLQRGRISNGAGRTTAILNVGSSYTTLAIVGGNNLPFIRDMPYAGQTIVNTIAAEKGVSTETVSRILAGPIRNSKEVNNNMLQRGTISNGAGYKDPAEPELELGDSLDRACHKLIIDVAETLRYYTAQEKTAFIEKIYVCGGFALVDGFVELLDRTLAARAVLWNPFDKIGRNARKHCRDILAKKGPALAVATGLAMRSIRKA